MTKMRQYNTKNLYFSKRITKALSGVFDYPLTTVEAPMKKIPVIGRICIKKQPGGS